MRIAVALSALALTSVSFAFTGVVPNAFAGTAGPGVFSLTSTGTTGRTFQFIIDESQLTSFVGSNINGMAWRLNEGSTTAWPPVAANFAFWDVWMGASVDPTVATGTFATNFTGTPTQVRSGAWTFNPGDYTIGGVPNNFGVNMALSNYTYNGGDLAILMRFSQQTGATTQSPFDAIAATDTANGWGTLFRSFWTGNSAGTAGGNANFIITQLSAQPVPEPASMVALGLGAVALLRRRRSKK
jgi:hypothetical protein